jgi:transcription factor E2F3
VKKRRIYDITNVLQGIGYLQKSGKNEIVWINPSKNQNLSKKKLFHQKNQKKNNDEQEIEEIENKINTNTEQLNSLKTNLELAKLRYLTIDDFKEYSIKNQNDLLVIKVNKDTSMNIIDQKDCIEAYHTVKQQINQKERDNNELLLDILNRKNQIYFESKNNDGLSFYFVRKGEIKETNSKEFNDNKNKANIFNKNKNIINTKHPLDNQKIFFPPNQQFNNNYNNSYNNMINYYPNGNKNTFMNNNYNKFKRIEPNKIIINNNLTIQRIYPLDNSEKQK